MGRRRGGLTLQLRAQLNKVDVTIRKRDGEYRVAFGSRLWNLTPQRRESTAYYTDWLDDALKTGLKMAEDEIRFAQEG